MKRGWIDTTRSPGHAPSRCVALVTLPHFVFRIPPFASKTCHTGVPFSYLAVHLKPMKCMRKWKNYWRAHNTGVFGEICGMQVNALLAKDRTIYNHDLAIQRYAVSPLSHNAGVVGWVPHADTLYDLIRDYRETRKARRPCVAATVSVKFVAACVAVLLLPLLLLLWGWWSSLCRCRCCCICRRGRSRRPRCCCSLCDRRRRPRRRR